MSEARPATTSVVPDASSDAAVAIGVGAADQTLAEVTRLTKEFPGIRALDSVSLAIRRAEVHGIVGENGAGKSTLMKILSGIEQPTAGSILLDGTPVTIVSAHAADRLGIAMIHQELNLVDELSVADNIFLGRERTRWRLVHDRSQHTTARELLKRVGCDIDPGRVVKSLSIAQQQLVEIAKALASQARLLIMDEPTAVLSERETTALLELIAQLKRQGVTILYISHHLSEVLAVCDRVTVMRDGRIVRTLDAKAASESELARLMVGRPLGDYYPRRVPAMDDVLLRVRDLGSAAAPVTLQSVSFEVRQGEILGFAGLIGAGRTEMGEAIVGLWRRRAGTIEIDGRMIEPRSPRDAVQHGVAYLSEDRKGRGLTIDMGVTENTTLVSLKRYCRPLIRCRAEDAAARRHVERLQIRVGTPPLHSRALRMPVRTLSGGNQQKVALAKWLEVEPRVLILDEPTRGVDIGAKREIYELICQLAQRGMSCVFISSELPELLGVCHRIAVMRDGSIAAILDASEASEERIMHLAAGVDA